MRKIDHPANCVGVVTVKWSVQNDDTKTVYSQTFGFVSGWLNKDAIKKQKEQLHALMRKIVERDKTYFHTIIIKDDTEKTDFSEKVVEER